MSRKVAVDHTYYDFSCYIRLGGHLRTEEKKAGMTFPARLHEILSEQSLNGIISWMPHRRAFKVLDKQLLIDTILPTYFNQNKFESFTRQLNGWNFKRMQRPGADYGCYYHQQFLRGLPSLTSLMTREVTHQGRLAPSPQNEPDFYRIPLPEESSPQEAAAPWNNRMPAISVPCVHAPAAAGSTSQGLRASFSTSAAHAATSVNQPIGSWSEGAWSAPAATNPLLDPNHLSTVAVSTDVLGASTVKSPHEQSISATTLSQSWPQHSSFHQQDGTSSSFPGQSYFNTTNTSIHSLNGSSVSGSSEQASSSAAARMQSVSVSSHQRESTASRNQAYPSNHTDCSNHSTQGRLKRDTSSSEDTNEYAERAVRGEESDSFNDDMQHFLDNFKF